MELLHAFLRHAGNYFVLRDIISLQNEISVTASYVVMFMLHTSKFKLYSKGMWHIVQLWFGAMRDLWNELNYCNYNFGNWQIF
jgi:hypothetical protein